MKRNLLLTSLLVGASIFAYSQSNDQKAIRQVLDQITNSMKKHDFAPLEHIYSSDFIFVNASGKKFTKTERLANLKSIPAPEEFGFQNEKIRIYGNTALMNGEVRLKPKGQEVQTQYVTAVFVKRSGHWEEVSAQGTTKAQ